MLTFRPIHPLTERETIVTFFIDSANGEESAAFNEEEYIQFAAQKAADLPEGFVIAEKDGATVGELVLRILPYEGRTIGYVSFVYLLPEYRGQGYSQQMFAYAEKLFKNHRLTEYHLRVSQINPRAIRFYEKQGLVILGEELNKLNQLCWRMGKKLQGPEK